MNIHDNRIYRPGSKAPRSADYRVHYYSDGRPTEFTFYVREGAKFPPTPTRGMGYVG